MVWRTGKKVKLCFSERAQNRMKIHSSSNQYLIVRLESVFAKPNIVYMRAIGFEASGTEETRASWSLDCMVIKLTILISLKPCSNKKNSIPLSQAVIRKQLQ